MTFISYAQNYEDVMLWRALKHVKNGFYIDVGAAWPDVDSVTKAFYEKGWRGINIEPNPQHYASLNKQRTSDVNLNLAVGNQIGLLSMNLIGATGLSTAIDEFAQKHNSAGFVSHRQEVPVTKLEMVFRENIKKDQAIHFLKVDVEGLEGAVLMGNDWKVYRPWIVVVEATLPSSQMDSYDSWEPILLKADYLFSYADGLNRFYVASEHRELLAAFKYPPNVFDGFLLSSLKQAEAKAEQAEAKAKQAEAKAKQAELTLNQLNEQLCAVHNSTYWRVTAPFRWFTNQWRLLRQHDIKTRIKPLVKKVMRKAVSFVMSHPKIKSWSIYIAYRLGIAERIKPFVRNSIFLSGTYENYAGLFSNSSQQLEIHELKQLSPRAREIYVDLKDAITQYQKGGN